MKPSNNETSGEQVDQHSVSFLAAAGWHRLVAGICLLACAGLIVMGIYRLFDPTEGRPGPASPIDYIGGIFFVLLGVLGFRFLAPQFRAPGSTSAGNDIDRK